MAVVRETPEADVVGVHRGEPLPGKRPPFRHPWHWSRSDSVVVVLLTLASLTLSAFQVSGHREYSPFDEYVYIDYYARVLDDGVVREGDETKDFARRYIACHKNRLLGTAMPQLCPTDHRRPDRAYPFDGASTASLYAPVYFYSIRLAAQPLVWIGVDFVQAGRYATSLWLLLGVLLLYGALRTSGASTALAASAGLVLTSSVGALISSTYISTDATAIPSGAAMLWLAVAYLRRPTRRLQVLAVGTAALVGLLKIQNLEAVGVFALTLILTMVSDHSSSRRVRLRDHRLVLAVVAGVVGCMAQLAWLVIRSALAVGPEPSVDPHTPYVLPDTFIGDLFKFLVSAPQQGTAAGLQLGVWAGLSVQVLSLLIPVGVLGAAVAARVARVPRSLGWAVVTTSVVAGPVLTVATIVTAGFYVPLPDRYGLALLPGMLACAALLPSQRSRPTNVVAVVVGVLMYAAAFTFPR